MLILIDHANVDAIAKTLEYRLFAFWGVGVVLAWGRGLPDD